MNQFDQGHRAEAMAMTLMGVGTSIIVLVLVTSWQQKERA
ncbi:putative membrane protein [Corynebacterium simulans]|uniref:Membrane protein n=1 Tax=Corynebacterium simulans TaxID=146827 RepID=A0ABR5VBJ4_9CORY|nr:putative membrane protein [Corynebacterium simulans]AMO91365.1 putative membrane protein [Corynebacterium simulans]KXU18857.1 putative membrane protein [Corynebacterium simulans]